MSNKYFFNSESKLVMPNLSSRSLMMAWIFALLTALVLSYGISNFLLQGTQKYDEFIPGLIAFSDYYKSGELHLVLFFSVTFLLAFTCFSFLIKSFESKIPFLRRQFVLSLSSEIFLVFLGLAFGTSIMKGKVSFEYLGILVFLAASQFFLSKRKKNYEMFFLHFALIPTFAFFSTLALFVFFTVFFPDLETSGKLCYYVASGVSAGSVLISLLISKLKPVGSLAWKLIFLIQIPIPLLILRPAYVEFIALSPYSITVNNFGLTLLITIVALLTIFNLKHFFTCCDKRAFIKNERRLSFFILLPSLLSISFYNGFYLSHISPLQVDNFHLGEMTLPWQQIVQFGQKSYDGFVSIQGIMALGISFLNWLFFDNSLACFISASSLMLSFLLMITAFFSSKLVGKAWSLALLPLLIQFSDRFYLIPLAFLLLANPELIKRRLLWCVCCFFTCLTAMLWNPATGAALTISMSPIGLVQIYFYYLEENKSYTAIARSLILFALCLLFSYITLPLLGLFEFLAENGSSSLLSFGTQYFITFDPSTSLPQYFDSAYLNRLFFELIRSGSWIIGNLLLLVPALFAWRGLNRNQVVSITCLTSVAILFTLFMLPQSLGRVDPPPHLSRTGAQGMLSLSFFIPFIFALCKNFGIKPFIPLFILGASISIPISYRSYSPASLASNSVAKISVPDDYILFDGPQQGYPQLGKLFVTNQRISEIQAFKEALSTLLKPGETYFDLTNNSAMHLFMNLLYPSPYPYALAVNKKIQRRVLARLEKEKPPVVWVSPAFEIDRGPASLRAYRIYRWFLLNGYTYVKKGLYGFLVSPQRADELPAIEQLKKPSTELTETFLRPDLDGVPISWGKNFEHLKNIVEIKNLIFSSSPGDKNINRAIGWEIDLEKNITGSESDYLLLQIENYGTKRPKKSILTLAWKEAGQDKYNDKPFKLWVDSGNLIIPTASDPRWLLGAPKKLKITINNPGKGSVWRLKGISILKLK